MKQLTLRVSDELASELKSAAAERHKSVNALASTALEVLVNPELEGTEAEVIRAKLARAGLLMTLPRKNIERPSDEEFARARAAAGKGTLLSDLVSEGRGER